MQNTSLLLVNQPRFVGHAEFGVTTGFARTIALKPAERFGARLSNFGGGQTGNMRRSSNIGRNEVELHWHRPMVLSQCPLWGSEFREVEARFGSTRDVRSVKNQKNKCLELKAKSDH